MTQFFQYTTRFSSVKGRVTGMPFWARLIMCIAAFPGLVLLALSFVALGISIFALLLLTVPAYRLLSALTSRGASATDERTPQPQYDVETPTNPNRRHVDVRIIENEPKPADEQ